MRLLGEYGHSEPARAKGENVVESRLMRVLRCCHSEGAGDRRIFYYYSVYMILRLKPQYEDMFDDLRHSERMRRISLLCVWHETLKLVQGDGAGLH